MDILFFLQMRTKFIRDFYSEASFAFTERMRKIETGEEPFEPPYSEDGEPPFLNEWMDAGESLDVLGQMCVSMLASTLQLYLKEWVNELYGRYTRNSPANAGIGRPEDNKKAFKEGWVHGYRVFFRDKLGINWDTAPSNLSLLEEIVLTRNRAQHPETILTLKIQQSKYDAAKYRRSFFADESEMKLFSDDRPIEEWVRPWRLNVTRDKLFAAIDEVDRFCMWLEEERQKWLSQLKEARS